MSAETEFVTVHLNLWESIAKAADPAPWKARSHPGDSGMIRDASGDILVYDEGVPSEESASHIALNDPGLILRTVAAMRAILELHEPYILDGTPVHCKLDDRVWPCGTVRHLGAIWEQQP